MLYELHQMYPNAPIYTAAYTPEKFPDLKDADVRPTWLDRVPLAKKKHQFFPLLRGLAFRMLDLSEYDLVISSCSAEAKYVRTGPNTLHICYCHTPIRYYWSDYEWYLAHPPFGRLNGLVRLLLPLMIGWLKRADYRAAQGVDVYVANSRAVQERIKKYYHRDSVVVYPCVDTESLTKLERVQGDYYLIVGRQVAYKRLDLAVEVFNELGLPLKVVGEGEEIARQKPLAKHNIEFLGWQDDAERNRLFAGAKGFVWLQEEDFGITAVEALAAGVPVLGYAKGGTLEYVTDGETGILVKEQTKASVLDGMKRMEATKFDVAKLRAKAEEYSTAKFHEHMRELVNQEWSRFSGSRDETR